MESSLGLPVGVFIFTFLLSAAVIQGTGLSPWNSDYSVSVPFGLIAALWTSYPFYTSFSRARYSFFHPAPMFYKHSLQETFGAVREVLQDEMIGMANKWNVFMADTNRRIIKADMRFSDIETRYEPSWAGAVHANAQNERRYVGLHARFDERNEGTAITFDFQIKLEGNQIFAADRAINEFHAALARKLGMGIPEENTNNPLIPAPPWWLLVVTLIALVFLFGHILYWVTG